MLKKINSNLIRLLLILMSILYPNCKNVFCSTFELHISEEPRATLTSFKECRMQDSIIDLKEQANTEEFVQTILREVDALRLDPTVIGEALHEIAGKFNDLDYFSVKRFDGTLTEEDQKAANVRLMSNWQKWYTYTMLGYFYKNESISKADAGIIATNLRSDNIDVYEFSVEPARKLIYTLGKPFYEDKYNFVQSICAELIRKISGFDTFINGENESDTR